LFYQALVDFEQNASFADETANKENADKSQKDQTE